jgi:hypothetical protein
MVPWTWISKIVSLVSVQSEFSTVAFLNPRGRFQPSPLIWQEIGQYCQLSMAKVKRIWFGKTLSAACVRWLLKSGAYLFAHARLYLRWASTKK